MKPIEEGLLDRIDAYIEQLFAPSDKVLTQNLEAARAAGLPPINVSATEGKLLFLIARIAGARRILEIGTLGGYSTTWLVRALPPGGTLVTLEVEAKHAGLATRSLSGVRPDVQVDVRVGDAAAQMRAMIAAGEPPFDLVFIDADKPRYVDYLQLSLALSRPGTVILADNVIRHGDVLDEAPRDESARGARAYNAAIALHPRLESLVIPLIREKIDGLSISIVKER